MEREHLIERARSLTWFNSIDFGDFVSVGREGSGEKHPNWSLYPTMNYLSKIDLRGRRCIDIGSGSGLIALGMKALGAEYVAAADALRSEAFTVAQRLTDTQIDYRITDVSALHLEKDWLDSFDVVVCSGLLYHLISPFQAIYAAKRLIKEGGIFILQSMTSGTVDSGLGGSFLNTYKSINGEPTTFTVPTLSNMRGLVDLGIFARQSETRIQNGSNEFHAILSVSRSHSSQMSGAPLQLRRTLAFFEDKGGAYPYGGYAFTDFTSEKPRTSVSESAVGLPPRIDMDPKTYTPTFPLCP